MKKRVAIFLCGEFLLLIASTAFSQSSSGKPSFELLKEKVGADLRAKNSIPANFLQGDCSAYTLDQLDGAARGVPGLSQYIYNGTYQWTIVQIGKADPCVYLQFPEKRGLDASDGNVLINASHMQFEPPTNTQEQTDPDIIRRMIDENPASKARIIPDSIKGPKPQLIEPPKKKAEDHTGSEESFGYGGIKTTIHSDGFAGTGGATGYPWNIVARIRTTSGSNGFGVQGSGIQISPHVVMTAAHVVSDSRISPPLEIQVFPSDGMPSAVAPIYIGDYVVDPGYSNTASPTANAQHDMAFLRLPNPHYLWQYPPIFQINSAVDSPLVNKYTTNSNYDPYAFVQYAYCWQCNADLNAVSSFFWNWHALTWHTATGTWGSDDQAAITLMGYKGTSTTPWYDSDIGLLAGAAYSAPYQYIFSGALYNGVVGVWGSQVYGGMSGGPILAGYDYYLLIGGVQTRYLGFYIIGSITASNGNVTLNNGNTLPLTTGLGSMSYNRSFVTTNQNWTWSLPSPSVQFSPNPAKIPTGSQSIPVTISWSAPEYATVSVYSTNNQPPYNQGIYCLGSAAGIMSMPATISVGERAQIFITPYTNCVGGSIVPAVPNPVLASVAINAQ